MPVAEVERLALDKGNGVWCLFERGIERQVPEYSVPYPTPSVPDLSWRTLPAGGQRVGS